MTRPIVKEDFEKVISAVYQFITTPITFEDFEIHYSPSLIIPMILLEFPYVPEPFYHFQNHNKYTLQLV